MEDGSKSREQLDIGSGRDGRIRGPGIPAGIKTGRRETASFFMEQAEKTEDLLNISEDLAKVQEEIEQITGRMNYLQIRLILPPSPFIWKRRM